MGKNGFGLTWKSHSKLFSFFYIVNGKFSNYFNIFIKPNIIICCPEDTSEATFLKNVGKVHRFHPVELYKQLNYTQPVADMIILSNLIKLSVCSWKCHVNVCHLFYPELYNKKI